MIVRLGFLIVTLFCLPLSAFASIINIEYKGHISSLYGEDLGYNLGDLVSGTVKIDLSKIEGIDQDTPTRLSANAIASKGLVTDSHYSGADTGNFYDLISIYDDIYNFSSLGYSPDSLSISEMLSAQGSIFKDFYLIISPNLDWVNLSGKALELELNNPEMLKNSYGAFGQFESNPFSMLANATFQLDSVKVHSVNVPESSSLILVFVGLLGFALRRK